MTTSNAAASAAAAGFTPKDVKVENKVSQRLLGPVRSVGRSPIDKEISALSQPSAFSLSPS